MAYEVVMPYHLHMPSYFLETFTESPYKRKTKARFTRIKGLRHCFTINCSET